MTSTAIVRSGSVIAHLDDYLVELNWIEEAA